jgi:hypothetical protein
MTAVNWANPYARRRGRWLKGNLHTHTREGSACAQMSLAEALARYAKLGYDFLCLSNHMSLTAPRHRRLLFLPGLEWNSPAGEHATVCAFEPSLLRRCIRTADQPALLSRLDGQEAIVVLNHPNWCEPAHYTREQLLERKPALGIEIYNAVIERLPGCALATDKWDFLLSNGRPLLGFASDDAHRVEDIGQGWIMVRAESRTPRAVARAIREGNFYASTGVTIRDIRREGPVITVDTADADAIWAVGAGGVRLAHTPGRRLVFDTSGLASPYVRFTAFGRGPAMAWTQPFFLGTPPAQGDVSPFVTRWRMSRLEPHRLGNAPAAGPDSALDWRPVEAQASPKGFVCATRYHDHQDGVVYFTNRFAVSRAADWVVSLGHDGGAALFADGQRVLFQPRRINPARPDRSQARLRLTRGTHTLTVCLDTDHGLGQGFFLRFIRPSDGGPGARRTDPFPRRLG